MELPTSRTEAAQHDAGDPIAGFRDRFAVPDDLIYLDGNSLGPPTRDAAQRQERVVREQWGAELVGGWNRSGWMDLPERVAETIAPLIGAGADEVTVADSTSVNLFKLLATALRLRPKRRIILSETANFPSDLYIAQGLADLLGDRVELRLVDRSELTSTLDDDVAVLMLTQVDFRSGELLDMGRWTRAAHGCGALMLWDLAHSAGALPVDLRRHAVDLAVGCGYKYLNGGPGAPAFAFAAQRLHDELRSPLWGWMGHADPFEFNLHYRPARGIAQLRVGTPPILSLSALADGVSVVAEIGIDRLWTKSRQLTQLFIERLTPVAAEHEMELATPAEADRRGSQVSFRHPDAYAIVQALIARGVVGDFRDPDLLRFGFAPAYLRFVDVWDAAARLRDAVESRAWDRPEFRVRQKVT